MTSNVMFTDTFEVNTLDYDPTTKKVDKKFDKVSRIDATSETYDTELVLDVNSEIYPMHVGDKIEVLLSTTLDENEIAGAVNSYDPTRGLGKRADVFEYIMRGVVFKYTQKKDKAMVYMSYGGLLMALKGESKVLLSNTFQVDSPVYLFVRKI